MGHRSSTSLLASALFVVLLTGCPAGDNSGPGDNNGENNGTNNQTTVSNNATNNMVVDYDCEPNLTGEVDAAPELIAAGGPESYRYEWRRDSLMVDVFEGGRSVGELVVEVGNDGTQLEWEGATRASAGDSRGTFTSAGGQVIDFETSVRAWWEQGWVDGDETEGGATLASPNEVQLTTRLTLDGGELLLVGWRNGVDESMRGPEIRVQVSLDAPSPAVGEIYEKIAHEEDGSFDLERYYRVRAGDVDSLTEQELQQFLDEAGVGQFGTSAALLLLLRVVGDPGWQLTSAHHLSTCVSDEPIPFLPNAQQTPLKCYFAYAGFVRAAANLPSCATLVGCLGPGVGMMKATGDIVDCECLDGTVGPYIDCMGSCSPITCFSTCADIKERACKGPVDFTGSCVTESELSLTGYCYCEYRVGEDGSCDSGDPHIRTWDGRGYSPHVPGEFVAARSEKGDFELQVRHEPVKESVCAVALVTGAAMRWGSHTVTILERRRAPGVWVDGVPREYSQLISDELALERQGDEWFLRGPSGTLHVRRALGRVAVSFTLTDSEIDDVEGIFGTRNGDPADDVYDAQGNVYTSPVSASELAEQATSWQVTEATSLFEYVDDESVDTFVDPDYIPRLTTIDDLPDAARADAEQACMDAGITDPIAYDNCVLDVGCTDDVSFTDDHVGPEYVDRLEVVADQPLDGWTPQGAGNGDWIPNLEFTVATNDGTTEGPSFFVSPDDRANVEFTGYITADPGDDDVVGLVFGYRAPIDANGDAPQTHDMFVFGWKQAGETHPTWGDASEGMYLAHVHGTAANVDEASTLFWQPDGPLADTMQVDVIATDFGAGKGWTTGFTHQVDVSYTSTGIRIDVDGATVFDVPAADLNFPIVPGRVGFFSLSQAAQFGFGATRTAQGYCDDWDDLVEVPCSAINDDTVLDGEVMNCGADLGVRANLTLINGSTVTANRIIVGSGGQITATGSAACPIRFTSNQDTPMPGDLRSFGVGVGSLPSTFEHVVFEYGGRDRFMLWTQDGTTVSLRNVTFRHTVGSAMELNGTVNELENVSFFDIPTSPIRIVANEVRSMTSINIDDSVAEHFIDVLPARMTIDGTWSDLGVPYRLIGGTSFDARLELSPGVEMLIAPDQRQVVANGGSIFAMGTAADPVVIASSAANPMPGDWRQFNFAPDAAPGELHHTRMSHGGGGGFGVIEVGTPMTFDNVTFSDNQDCDVFVYGAGAVDSTATSYVPCN